MQASFAPKVIPVEIDDGQQKKIVERLCKEFDEALTAREDLDKKREVWLKQYNSRLVDPSSDDEIQLDIPTTHEFLGQQAARILNPIFSQASVFTCTPRFPNLEKQARVLEKALDFITDKVHLLRVCRRWFTQAQVFGVGIVKVLFVSKKCKIRDWDRKELVDEFGEEIGEEILEVERWVTEKEGPYPEAVPVADFVFPARSMNVQDARWVCHRLYLDKRDINEGIRDGAYDKESLMKLGEPTSKMSEFAVTERKMIGLDVSNDKAFEILEFWASEDIDGDGYEEEVVITVDRQSKFILRFVHNWLHGAQRRPFVTCVVEDGGLGINGISSTYRLEPLHRAYSLSTMQRLNAAAKANEILVLAPYGSDIGNIFKDGRIKGGYYEVTGDINSVKQFNLSQPFTQSEQLENQILGHMERDQAINEILFGVQNVDRPTATGEVRRIEESQQPLFLLLETFRESLAEVGKQMLSRVKQYYPAGMEIYLTTGGEMIADFVQWPDGAIEESAIIETTASSATVNKMLRRQEKLAMVDKWPMIFQTKFQLASMAATPGPQSQMALKMLQGYDQVVNDYLEEFDIPNPEVVNPDLTREVMGAQIQVQQQQAAAQAAGQGAVQQGTPGGGPGAPGVPAGAPPPGGPTGGPPPGMEGAFPPQ